MSYSVDSKSAQEVISFLQIIGKLKDTPRTGWVNNDIRNPESVSDHMYRMSLMCMMCPDTSLDKTRMIKMALCHDAGESIVGDITPFSKISKQEKQVMELEAVQQLSALASSSGCASFSKELHDLFREYEDQKTPESIFVRDMDLLEMIIQAHSYEGLQPKKDLGSFFESGEKIQHPWAKAIFERLKNTRPFLSQQQSSNI
ncbi:unnamed protein product [Phytomonas sp. EM1]|nr:unnamed protein product [Phytomonas sp. EM1]|eukprot:CCW61392.1 unnamed protein product [Phytomonas sp. isolate EM1]